MRGRKRAYKTAAASILAALAVLVLYLGSLFPTGRWGLAAVAGLMPAAAIISAGISAGALCWAGTAILAFFLVSDKLTVLLFGVLFGVYPLVKNIIERLRRPLVEWPLKLIFFNCVFSLIYLTMKTAVLASLPASLSVVWALYLVGNIVFLLYDYGFSRLISLYMARVGGMGRR